MKPVKIIETLTLLTNLALMNKEKKEASRHDKSVKGG